MSNHQSSDENAEESNEEASSLLSRLSHDEEHHNSKSHTGRPRLPVIQRRQPSISIPPSDGLPRKHRTPNRVRFEVEEHIMSGSASNSHAAEPEEENFLHNTSNEEGYNTAQRVPLLTGIEAPSVTVASTDYEFDADHLLENSRPKSGMSSAFMNMANSIIQAGMTMGIILLVVLTVTVDWTIRLIITNSKLSGANSFQATMEHCYGRSGLVAISVGARKTRAYNIPGTKSM
ncbi:MAG: hypothetical protein Q9213_006386 [Squamulea squamosa]